METCRVFSVLEHRFHIRVFVLVLLQGCRLSNASAATENPLQNLRDTMCGESLFSGKPPGESSAHLTRKSGWLGPSAYRLRRHLP